MNIELTEAQQRAIEQAGETLPLVINPRTHESYVLVRAERHEPMQQGAPSGSAEVTVPAGIRRSQEALRRDLPQLLRNDQFLHQWVAYEGDRRIGIANDGATLLRQCLARGLRDDEYYIGWIDPTELIDEEELR